MGLHSLFPCRTVAMVRLLRVLMGSTTSAFKSRRALLLEIIALRQQLAVLKDRRPRPQFAATDRFFWVAIRYLWPDWKNVLVIA
jgi:hypothetical protein